MCSSVVHYKSLSVSAMFRCSTPYELTSLAVTECAWYRASMGGVNVASSPPLNNCGYLTLWQVLLTARHDHLTNGSLRGPGDPAKRR